MAKGKITILLCGIAALLTAGCSTDNTKTGSVKTENWNYKPISVQYHMLAAKDSIKTLQQYPAAQLAILQAVNRADAAHLVKMDSVLIPDNLNEAVNSYSPFPQAVEYLKDIDKIIFFSYPAQYFGAYEHGRLVRSGPTNMGRKADPTPTGLLFANWKAEETKSTFNDEWELKWNVNVENTAGVGWHQYDMPGYPASHSCLRLKEDDAKYLYEWVQQWVVKGTDDVLAKGTPVVIFGSYPFGAPKPWMQLAANPLALDINIDALKAVAEPHMAAIMAAQKQRAQQPGK